jgi:predicted ATPase/class 3 adenylate cyclase
MNSELPSGTVAFLYTDIEGSTPLWEREPEQMRAALARHDAILRAAIAEQGGHVYKVIGDAFQAAFDVPARAVAAALAAQRALAGERWPTSGPIRVRMGLHVGPAEAEGDDYASTHTLNRVARVMSAGHGGQALLTLALAELVRERLPSGVTLRDLGRHRLKGLTQLEHLFQLVAPDLPADFPPLQSLGASPNNLPVQLTRFIGRDAEVAEVKRLVSLSRLVTLTGSGGCGKTRLAIQAASELGVHYPNGVWFIELAPVTDPELVSQTILSILNLREDSHRIALDVLIDYLRAKTLLLVLDNCEHLIEACAHVSEALLRACPKLCILATSREALGVAGEAAYHVPSLHAPNPAQLPSLDRLEEVDSIRLFVERAATAKPGFTLTPENAAFLAQICYRLDGIPLALELAASRVKALSPKQIASRLDDRFRLLTGGSRTALPRQQTLRAMMDWSYSLLAEQEQTLFRRLAVFVGGWTLEAAEAVCGEGSSRFDVLDLLARLVDKSLIFTEESTGETRYHRLETIRQYSRERFFETDDVETVRDRHLEFFAQFAELVDEELKGGEQIVWQNRMAAELDNLRAALEWGLSRNPDSALRIAGAANLFWTAAGYSLEGFRWTTKALEQVEQIPEPTGVSVEQRRAARARALRGLARLYLSLGDNASAKRAAEESVALYRQSRDRRGLSFALVVLAYPLEFLGERARAEAVLQESHAIARAEGDVYVICRSLNLLARVMVDLHRDLDVSQRYVEESLRLAQEAGLRSQEAQAWEISGIIAMHAGDDAGARADFQESVRVYQEVGATFNVILEKSNLAHLERRLGNTASALEYYRETIVAFREIGQTGAVAHQLECFGFIAVAQDQPERALQLLGAANALREKGGTPMTPDEQITFDERLKALREKMDSLKFDSLWSHGRALAMESAIAYALEPDSGNQG